MDEAPLVRNCGRCAVNSVFCVARKKFHLESGGHSSGLSPPAVPACSASSQQKPAMRFVAHRTVPQTRGAPSGLSRPAPFVPGVQHRREKDPEVSHAARPCVCNRRNWVGRAWPTEVKEWSRLALFYSASSSARVLQIVSACRMIWYLTSRPSPPPPTESQTFPRPCTAWCDPVHPWGVVIHLVRR